MAGRVYQINGLAANSNKPATRNPQFDRKLGPSYSKNFPQNEYHVFDITFFKRQMHW